MDETVKLVAKIPLDRPNRNGRVYTSECMEKAIAEEHIQEGLKNGTLLGGFAEPPTGNLSRDLSIDPTKAAFSINRLNIEKGEDGNNLVAGLSTLPNHLGALMKHAIHTKVAFSLAPRGVGKVEIVDGVPTVQPGFRVVTYDLIKDEGGEVIEIERKNEENE